MNSKWRNIAFVVVVVLIYFCYANSRELSKLLQRYNPSAKFRFTNAVRKTLTPPSSSTAITTTTTITTTVTTTTSTTTTTTSSSSLSPSSTSSSAAASMKNKPTVSTAAARRHDDFVWYDYGNPPNMLFYAYSAFVDDRPLRTSLRK